MLRRFTTLSLSVAVLLASAIAFASSHRDRTKVFGMRHRAHHAWRPDRATVFSIQQWRGPHTQFLEHSPCETTHGSILLLTSRGAVAQRSTLLLEQRRLIPELRRRALGTQNPLTE